MSFELTTLTIDEDLRKDGVWVELFPGAKFRIAGAGNAAFQEMWAELEEKFLTLGRDPTEEEKEEMIIHCLSRTIVLEWKGLTIDGKNLPYNHKNADRILGEWDEVTKKVLAVAGNQNRYRIKKNKDIEENSEPASGGKSSTQESA
jgi:hypothetical protein